VGTRIENEQLFYQSSNMKRKHLIIITLLGMAGIAVLAELYYFRFHTYFQRTVVEETLPPTPSGQETGEPRATLQGSFVEVDAIHKGSGTARIVEQGGVRYLRFENFEVTNGPDLFVYLSESKTPGDSLESIEKYINLGPLKGNVGNQTYEIPGSLEGYTTAVIWCQKFGVLFSYAVMQ
jgi:hypothetical protein